MPLSVLREKQIILNILVTGGAGYIGSVVVEELIHRGHRVVVLDNLQQGHRQAVHPMAAFFQGDLADCKLLDHIFSTANIDTVFHFAADALVGGSNTNPQGYFHNNLRNGLNLLETMLAHGVRRLVFSSTAAIYGEPDTVPISEEAPPHPINVYGESKLMFEKITNWYHRAYDFKVATFRFFNVAGATRRCGEHHTPETHLIPLALKTAQGHQDHLQVFGADFNTPDGTCIRDYLHVADVAQAHISALSHLDSMGWRAYNIGNGGGFSVYEVIEAARRVTGKEIKVKIAPRRVEDPARLVASADRIRRELNWRPKYTDLESIIETAWRWQLDHPHGYTSTETVPQPVDAVTSKSGRLKSLSALKLAE